MKMQGCVQNKVLQPTMKLTLDFHCACSVGSSRLSWLYLQAMDKSNSGYFLPKANCRPPAHCCLRSCLLRSSSLLSWDFILLLLLSSGEGEYKGYKEKLFLSLGLRGTFSCHEHSSHYRNHFCHPSQDEHALRNEFCLIYPGIPRVLYMSGTYRHLVNICGVECNTFTPFGFTKRKI